MSEPTVELRARAWQVTGERLRAVYAASGSAEPCELRFEPGAGGRVLVRVLNPPRSTADLRFRCVESELPADATPSRRADLSRADRSIRRQLRSGRGCIRIPAR